MCILFLYYFIWEANSLHSPEQMIGAVILTWNKVMIGLPSCLLPVILPSSRARHDRQHSHTHYVLWFTNVPWTIIIPYSFPSLRAALNIGTDDCPKAADQMDGLNDIKQWILSTNDGKPNEIDRTAHQFSRECGKPVECHRLEMHLHFTFPSCHVHCLSE